ncbi:hemagglutinin-related protein, partial [Acetonema longum DSM 6540]
MNGKDILLDAANDVNLESAANTVDSRSESSQKSASVGVDLASGGVTISGQRGNGNTDAHQVNYNETLITAENNLTVKSGSDINIVGGQAKGDIVKVEASGDLNLASQQDRETYTEKNKSTNGSIGIGAGVTGNVGVNKGKIDSDYQSVKEQTGIFAGSGGFAIKVEGNTDLKGAVIGSEATTDKNKLDTGSLTWSDIENKAEYEASNSGLSLDFKDGKLTSDLTPDMPVNGDAASTTQSAVAAGSIEIRTGNTDISQLNRNTDQALNTLGTIFDKKTVQEKQELV